MSVYLGGVVDVVECGLFFKSNNNNILFKVQYPMYIEIRVQWTIHKMGCKFKPCDKYVIIQELT